MHLVESVCIHVSRANLHRSILASCQLPPACSKACMQARYTHPLQARGEGLVKSLHTSRTPGLYFKKFFFTIAMLYCQDKVFRHYLKKIQYKFLPETYSFNVKELNNVFVSVVS